MDRKILRVISVLLVLCVFTPLPQARADDFYKGKTIKIVVGFLAGDVYDLWARLYAQYMPKHIPGKPDIIVQNMTGAGSMIAANHVYSVAKPDGLTLGSIFPLYISISLSDAKRCSLTGQSSSGLALRFRTSIKCTCGQMPHIRRSKTFVRLQCLPSAAPPAPVQRVTIYPNLWRKP